MSSSSEPSPSNDGLSTGSANNQPKQEEQPLLPYPPHIALPRYRSVGSFSDFTPISVLAGTVNEASKLRLRADWRKRHPGKMRW